MKFLSFAVDENFLVSSWAIDVRETRHIVYASSFQVNRQTARLALYKVSIELCVRLSL